MIGRKFAVPVLATTLLLAACGGGDSESNASAAGTSASSEPYRVLIISGITGPLASVTEQVVQAVEVEAEILNEDGGIGGRTIEVETLDSQGDPTKSVSALQDFLSQGEKPDLVYAGVSSPETLALLPLLTRERILSTATTGNAAINDPAAYPYHFGAAPTTADQIKTLQDQLEENDVENLSVLVPSDVYGDGVIAAVEIQAEAAGATVNEFRFNTADVDYAVAYQRALDADPDAVYLAGTGVAVGRLLEARSKAGGIAVPTFGDSGMGDKTLLQVSPDILENFEVVVFAHTVFKPEGERSEALQSLLEGLDLSNVGNSVLLYSLAADGLRSVALAADQAESTETEELAAAMESFEDAPEDYWITQPEGYNYSDETHFPVSPPAAYAWVSPRGLEDGLWQVAE